MEINQPWVAEYPPGVPADVDLGAYPSATALLLERLRTYASRPHSRLFGSDVSYRQIDAWSRDLAAFWQARGIAFGERIAIMLPNCPQYAVTAVAVLRIGAVIVNVNPLCTPRELRVQLRDAGAVAIVVLENFAHVVEAVRADTQLRVVVLSGLADLLPAHRRIPLHLMLRHVKRLVPPYRLPQAVQMRAALRSGRRAPLTEARPARGDVAMLQYTGGTTGVPKGAMLTHGNVLAGALTAAAWQQPLIERRPALGQVHVLLALPMSHIYAFMNGMVTVTCLGGLQVLVPNPRDVSGLLRIWARQPIHLFAGINTLYNAILAAPEARRMDFSALRLCAAGGAATQSAVAERWKSLTGRTIHEGFGMSETCSGIASNPWNGEEFSASAGVPLPGVEVRLCDDAGVDVPPGAPGELCVRGPMVMAGYWQHPQETARVMTADGFLRTGDVALVTPRGHLRIVDRKKDMILVSGFNVYPNEVEEVLARHPGVLECAVIGLPDAETGEAVCAVVVPRCAELTEESLRSWCREQLTGYKRPRRLLLRPGLPKTPVGKVLRRELRDPPKA